MIDERPMHWLEALELARVFSAYGISQEQRALGLLWRIIKRMSSGDQAVCKYYLDLHAEWFRSGKTIDEVMANAAPDGLGDAVCVARDRAEAIALLGGEVKP